MLLDVKSWLRRETFRELMHLLLYIFIMRVQYADAFRFVEISMDSFGISKNCSVPLETVPQQIICSLAILWIEASTV